MSTKAISNLDAAIEALKEKHKKWQAEHPNETSEPVCPICRGSGLKMLIYDEFGKQHDISERYKPGMYEYFEPCPCAKIENSQMLNNNKNFASVPGLFKDARISNLRKDVYKEIRSFELIQGAKNDAIRYITAFSEYEKRGMGLYIWAKRKGGGKSRLACTISNELIEIGVRNKYASASNILSEIQASWKNDSIPEQRIINKYIEPRLLIIDDIGAKSGQQWMDEKFFQIIDARYQQNKPTIITSNFEADKLPFDDRITDRVCDVNRFHLIHMPEESVRRITQENTESFRDIYDKYKNGGANNEL